jgi:hypothetical protein
MASDVTPPSSVAVHVDSDQHSAPISPAGNDLVGRTRHAPNKLACGRVEREPHPGLDLEPHGEKVSNIRSLRKVLLG